VRSPTTDLIFGEQNEKGSQCVPYVRVADSNSDKHHHTFYRTLTYWDHQAVDTPIYDKHSFYTVSGKEYGFISSLLNKKADSSYSMTNVLHGAKVLL
jgi:hypothetical protein